ncbi:hypothetical protein [Sphingobium sp. AS12]|uniref:DUF7673 family protein n=1 Tax=Sphingobium sp. AS12 TaxID=2849495 RepID=UPI0034A4E9C8
MSKFLTAANKPIPPFRIVRAPPEHPIDSTDDFADLPIAMSVAPMIRPEIRAAVDRLFDLAQSDTGQAGRVANFLLAWHNGMDWGGFDIADLFGLDRAIAADMATVFAFLGQYPSGIYPDAFVGEAQIIAILRRWRKFSDE